MDAIAPRYDVRDRGRASGGRGHGAAPRPGRARGCWWSSATRPATDTLSTHALMRGAVMQLQAWGLADRLVAAGTPPVRRTSFVYGEEEVAIEIGPQHGVEALMAPRRTLLDPMLAAAAAAGGRGGPLRRGVRGRAARRRRAGSAARASAPPRGFGDVRAGLVIGADGRRSRVARATGARVVTAGRHACATRYAYVAGLEDRGYRWHFGRGVGGRGDPDQRRPACGLRQHAAGAFP